MRQRYPFPVAVVISLFATSLVAPSTLASEEPGVPGVVQGLTVVNAPGQGAFLDWSAPLDDGGSPIQVHHIYRASSLDAEFYFVGHVTAPQTNFTDFWGGWATHWYYAVAAYNEVGLGNLSEPVEFTAILPTAPRGLFVLTSGSPGEVVLGWNPPADHGGSFLVAYRIYRARANETPQLVGTVEQNGPSPDGLSFVERNVEVHVPWSYTVTAVNGVGEGPASGPANVTLEQHPTAPRNFTATAGPGRGQVGLQWEAPADAGDHAPVVSYALRRRSSIGLDAWKAVATVDNATFSYTVSGLGDGAPWDFFVYARNAEDPGSIALASATTFARPGAPRSLDAVRGGSGGQIVLTWEPPLDDGGTPVTGYRIHMAASAAEPYYPIGTASSCCTFTHSGLGAGVTRHYKVAAMNLVGEGSLSGGDFATTIRAASPPLNLTGAAGPGRGEATLSWLPPTDTDGQNVTGYRILSKPSSSGTYTLHGTVGAGSLSYTAAGLGDNTWWDFKVAAVTTAGQGALSSPVSVQTFGRPAAPGAVAAGGPGFGNVTVTWSPPAQDGRTPITAYRVYRSGAPLPIAELPANQTAYVDANRPLTAQNTYSVSAVNLVGEGAKDGTGCVRPMPIPFPCL